MKGTSKNYESTPQSHCVLLVSFFFIFCRKNWRYLQYTNTDNEIAQLRISASTAATDWNIALIRTNYANKCCTAMSPMYQTASQLAHSASLSIHWRARRVRRDAGPEIRTVPMFQLRIGRMTTDACSYWHFSGFVLNQTCARSTCVRGYRRLIDPTSYRTGHAGAASLPQRADLNDVLGGLLAEISSSWFSAARDELLRNCHS